MQTQLNPAQVAERGEAIYSERIKSEVEPGNNGKFLILDIESGDYEIDADDMAAQERIDARRPEGVMYGIRIGTQSMYFIGGGWA